MEFITEGDTVRCVRVISGTDTEKRITVTTFHADVDRVAPHVAASLTPPEIKELEQWLTDRAKLQAALETKPIEKTIVEALPEVIEQAVRALDELEQLDVDIYQALRGSVFDLTRALDRVENLASEKEHIELEKMPDSEALKERLDTIKGNLKK